MTSKMSTALFSKSFSTMVKGIRNHKDRGESEYIAKCIAEIKEELQSTFPEVKTTAVQKLVYLQMLNYDISWASFNIVEVMSLPWFGHKRIGYLAASLAFTQTTDVILLTTHLFRKGFSTNSASSASASSNLSSSEGAQYETGAAISCLASICTQDLAQDLLTEVYGLMNSSRPYIRKKAVLVLLKIFKQWPKALRLSFDRLKEKLTDENGGVVSAAVYVICELAAKNPKNYLALAPQFFQILTTSSNNWVLIKVVKLLGSLVPLEPRLAKKIQEPLVDIVTTTPAKSLLYECVNTLLCGELKSKTVVRLCLEKLKQFIEDPDQNLKYLGLLGLHKLMRAHPKIVAEHKDLILNCLNDEDVTIRMRALDLITSLASQANLQGIVKKLIEHLDSTEGQYREHVLDRIIGICSQEDYAYIADFEWYIATLVGLTHLPGVQRENAVRITQQLMDVTIRVPAVRKFSVKSMSQLLIAGRLLSATSGSGSMREVLYAAGFIVGEFAEYISLEHLDLIRVLTHANVATAPANVQNVFLQSALKVFASALLQPFDEYGMESDGSDESSSDSGSVKPSGAEDGEDGEDADLDSNGVKKRKVKAKKRTFSEWMQFIADMLAILRANLPLFTQSNSVEVQERAVAYKEFCSWFIQFGKFQALSQPEKEKQSTAAVSSPAAAPVQKSADLLNFDPLNGDSAASPSPAPAAEAVPSSPSSGSFLPKDRYRALAIQLNFLFAEHLNPVNPKAQKKVPLPKGLDLDSVINEESKDHSDSSDSEFSDGEGEKKKKKKDKEKKDKRRSASPTWEEDFQKPLTAEEKAESAARLKQREEQKANDPFYLKDRNSITSSSALLKKGSIKDSTYDIPIRRLDDADLPPLNIQSDSSMMREQDRRKEKEREKKAKKKSKRSKDDESSSDSDDIFNPKKLPSAAPRVFKVIKGNEMPEGAVESEEEKGSKDDEDSESEKEKEKEKDKKDRKSAGGKEKDKEKEKDEDKKKKKKKDKEKEKDEDKKKEKDRKKDKEEDKEKEKEKKSKRDKEKDRDDKEKPKKEKKEKKDKKDKEKSISQETSAPAKEPEKPKSIIDMFDPMA